MVNKNVETYTKEQKEKKLFTIRGQNVCATKKKKRFCSCSLSLLAERTQLNDIGKAEKLAA